jgi:hypothetical protein
MFVQRMNPGASAERVHRRISPGSVSTRRRIDLSALYACVYAARFNTFNSCRPSRVSTIAAAASTRINQLSGRHLVALKNPSGSGPRINNDREIRHRPLHQRLRPMQRARVKQDRIARTEPIGVVAVTIDNLARQHVDEFHA